jgi:TRAP-type C4-dicarboxylate transport system substrate-binding protein
MRKDLYRKLKGMLFGLAILALASGLMLIPMGNQNVAAATKGKTHTIVVDSTYAEASDTLIGEKLWWDAMQKASNGRIKFDLHYASSLVPKKKALEACSRGTVDMVISYGTYFSGWIDINDIQAGLPFNTRSYEDTVKLWWETDIGEITNRHYREKGNVLWPRPFLQSPYAIFSNKPIRTLEDCKGLKIRCAGGLQWDSMKALGFTPVQLITADIYTGMQRGIVDAVLFPAFGFKSYKLGEVSKYILITPIMGPCTVACWMNLDKFNSLPKDLQQLLTARHQELYDEEIKLRRERQEEAAFKGARAAGLELVKLTPQELVRWEAASKPVWEQVHAKGGDYAKIIEIIDRYFQRGWYK